MAIANTHEVAYWLLIDVGYLHLTLAYFKYQSQGNANSDANIW